MGALLRGQSGVTYLDNTPLTIGRSRQNRLVAQNGQLSGKHAEIQPLGDGRYQVVDVGSSNGTHVNGVRLSIGSAQVLNVGDKLRLGGPGGLELIFEMDAALASPGLAEPVYVAAAPGPLVQAPPAYPTEYPPAYQPPAPSPMQAPQAMGGFAPPPANPPPVLPVPGPLPRAILTPATAPRRRFAKPLVMLGSVLVVVLLVTGVVLGAKGLGGQSSKTQAATPTPPPAPAVVQTASVSVQGKDTTVLTNAQGLTLYYFKPDTASATACTGSCIEKWPPLLFQGAGTPTASDKLPGDLSIQTSDNGPQVAYNKHPLYAFSGDTAPGQANGEGKSGKWFVATPDLEVNTDSPAVVQTATVSIDGTDTTVLTNAQGMTLYFFTPDTADTIACTDTCATTWLPLLFDGSGTPGASSPLPGTLSVVQGANGPQVEYNGHPLYTFTGDTAAGQTNGQGKGDKWFVATPDLANQ